MKRVFRLKYLIAFLFLFRFSFTVFPQNLSVIGINYPLAANCVTNLSQDSIVVVVKNLGATSENNINISYKVNNGVPVTEVIPGPLAANASITYHFATLFSKAPGVNDIKVFTSLPGDVSRVNDTAVVRLVTKINAFPYYENFEVNNGGYAASGSNSSWGWGSPNKPKMKPGEGLRSWYNGFATGDGYYLASDFSVLTFPCFDFTNIHYPMISFKFFLEVENGWESVVMEYSTNGSTFQPIGTAGETNGCNTQNWYNAGATWSGNTDVRGGSWGAGCGNNMCGKWVVAKHCIEFLKGQPNVYFRLRFASTGTQQQAEGVGIDSVFVGEAVPPPFSFNANSVCANAPMSFMPVLHPCITASKWDFGDATPVISAVNAVHIYKTPGTYNAKLIVTSYCGKQDTFTKAVTVLPPPAVTSVPGTLDSIYCATSGAVMLAGTRSPGGGSFTVDGNSATTFDPSGLNIGLHSVVYTYTEPAGNQCTVYDTQYIRVYEPEVTIDSLGGSYCLSSPAIILKGTPSGGNFTVDGVSAGIFDAATAGLGQHVIVYTYTDAGGCTGTATRLVDVVSNIVAQINGLPSSFCSYEPAVALDGTPSGGVFTVDGVNTSTLDPQSLSAGTHRVIYSYSDGGSCSDKDTADITIVKITAAITNLDSVYCPTSAAVPMQGTPSGGTFYINNVNSTTFNPASLAVGLHKVMYVYVDPVSSCVDTVRKTVRIDKPVIAITGVDDSYCKDAAAVTLTANPSGGVFKLNGNTVTEINPSILATGTYTLSYTYQNPLTGCSNTQGKQVEIAPLPTAHFVNLDTVYCITSDLVPLNAEPSGGAFTIDHIPVQMLDPSVLSIGIQHKISYQYVEQNYGCVVTIDTPVWVVTPPAVSISGLNGSYCSGDAAFIPSGNPSGGIFVVDDQDTVTSILPSSLATGQHKISYIYSAANGCDASVNQQVDILPLPTGNIIPNPVSICEGESITLTFNGTAAITWNTGAKTKSINITPSITQHYWIKADACASFYDSVKVTVKPMPVAAFTITPEEGLLPLAVVATAQQISSNMIWRVDTTLAGQNINPFVHTFNTPGQHSIILIIDSLGCVDSVSMMVNVIEKVLPIKLPNVFTPDHDGINEDFGVNMEAMRFVKELSFQVYNRWGNLLFTTSDPYARWDGTDKGATAPDGVYFYVLKATLNDNSDYNLTGSVTIIRANN